VVWTPETVGRAGARTAVKWIFITVIATVIVTITEPVWLNTDGCILTLQVILGTGHIAGATQGHCLITGGVVLAVIHTIANLQLWDAAEIITSVLTEGASWIVASNLVCSITTVILMVALPGLEDASTIATPILCWGTGVIAAVIILFIAVIPTIVISITGPQPGYTLAVAAVELVAITAHRVIDAHLALIHRLAI
jgi:hypothetical protein